jgi:hypothetical protein
MVCVAAGSVCGHKKCCFNRQYLEINGHTLFLQHSQCFVNHIHLIVLYAQNIVSFRGTYCLHIQPCRWSWYVPLKHQHLPTSLHGVTIHKTNIDIFTVMRTSNLIACLLWNSEVHYHDHKILDPVHTLTLNPFKIQFNIILVFMPESSKWSLPLRFTK